jgi:hypothetical protein
LVAGRVDEFHDLEEEFLWEIEELASHGGWL